MSSLHQDRLLIEGTEPVTGTASTLPTARGTRRRAVGSSEETATSKVPTQRQGKAQRSGTPQTTSDRPASASRAKRPTAAKAAVAASGTIASRAKAATVKAATAKAATAKAATAKAATAARAAAVTTVANGTASVRTARAAAAARTATPAEPTGEHAVGAKRAIAAKVAAAPVKAAVAKPAPAAKPIPAAKPAAVAKPAAAKTAVAKPTPAAKPAAVTKPAAAKTAVAKPTPAAAPLQATSAKAAPSVKAAPAVKAPAATAVRPTPHKRATPSAEAPVMAPVTDVAELLRDEAADVVVVRKDVVVEPAVESTVESAVARLPRFLRRRPPVVRRRPSLYMAAALVGALGVAVTAGGPEAQATSTMSNSVSVAEQLGIEAGPTEAITPADATQRLGELAASRNVRDDEQAAAAQLQAEADRLAAEVAAEAARPKAALPVQGARLTSTFGPRWGTLHAGIDLAAPIGTPEYAAMDGVVLEAGPASGYGNVVYIQHDNGDVTVYGHMEEILVTAGQVVKAGDTIALLGNRGQSTGPHLHFEVHVGGIDGQKIDPLPWLRERGIDI
jgi:murein DD-endopeptidase MepM/ murein hydrolase activator NlpD